MSCRPQKSPRRSAKDVFGRPYENLFTIVMKNGRTGFWGTRRAEFEAKASEEIVTDVRERLRALLGL
jgi:hypothetical protein